MREGNGHGIWSLSVIDQSAFRVAILIVGFRNPKDVCACLAALSRSAADPCFEVFIIENGGSESFRALCEALMSSQGPCTVGPPSEWANSITSSSDRFVDVECLALKAQPSSRVWIACATRNLGYAGGINAWINQLQTVRCWQGIWILNPDAEPEPGALDALVKRSVSGQKGMVGSTILSADDSYVVHCRGGHHWRKFRTNTAMIGCGELVDDAIDLPAIENALDCISGASMYVTRDCLEKIGLMDERFFLYFEDADWTMRAKKFGLGYARDSIVRHKGGTTIGGARLRADRSWLSVYLESRNRIHFVRLYWRGFLPWAYLIGLAYATAFLFARSPKNFKAALDGLRAAITGETGWPKTVKDPNLDRHWPASRNEQNSVLRS
jgi:N-acetylglucosaminyl-diphospho-decaprenol L-rhamnosyltransferase